MRRALVARADTTAAPHVAGLATQLLSNGDMTTAQLKAKLKSLATPNALSKVCTSPESTTALTRPAKNTPNSLLNNGRA